TPTRSQRKGQPVQSKSGKTKRIARTGSWLLDEPVRNDVTIEEEIESFLGSLPPVGRAWATICDCYRVDLLCDVFVRGVNQGFQTSPGWLGMVGEGGVRLGVDIFCEPDEGQEKALEERLGPQKNDR